MGVGAGLYMCDVVVKSSRSISHLLMSSCLLIFHCKYVSTIAPGAQFAAIVYDVKVKQCGATWGIRWKFMTACSSTALSR